MTKEEKIEAKEIFDEWTTFIEDRVDSWAATAPTEIVKHLDYSSESLKDIF